jgi:hypothetical protein
MLEGLVIKTGSFLAYLLLFGCATSTDDGCAAVSQLQREILEIALREQAKNHRTLAIATYSIPVDRDMVRVVLRRAALNPFEEELVEQNRSTADFHCWVSSTNYPSVDVSPSIASALTPEQAMRLLPDASTILVGFSSPSVSDDGKTALIFGGRLSLRPSANGGTDIHILDPVLLRLVHSGTSWDLADSHSFVPD